jgi:hypothetical protein
MKTIMPLMSAESYGLTQVALDVFQECKAFMESENMTTLTGLDHFANSVFECISTPKRKKKALVYSCF